MSERKPVLIQAKKACQRVKRKHVTLWKTLSIVLAVVMVLSGVLNVVLGIFDNTVAAFVGGTFWELVNEDASAQNFTPDFATPEEMTDRGEAL